MAQEFMSVDTRAYLKNAIEIPGTRVWRDPFGGKVYCGELGERTREAQFVDITAITTAELMLEEVLGLARPDYTLRNVCRLRRTTRLSGDIVIGTKFAAVAKVPPLVEAELVKQAFAKVSLSLWKNVVHVALSDEERTEANIDIYRSHSLDAAGALADLENKQIKEIAEAATAIAGTDWGTGTNNPYDDIGKVIDAVGPKGYNIDFIAAHPLAWGDFFSNPFVKGSATGVRLPAGKVFDVPGLPGVTGYSDYEITNTLALVGSVRAPALVFAEGPATNARYRNEAAGFDAFIVRQWLQPYLVIGDAIRRLTGVHA